MKINTLMLGTAAIAVAVGAFVAANVLAQTAAPVAKPATTSAPAQAVPKARPHRDGASGGHVPGGHAPSFDELDTNHDGVVSKAEFDAWRAAHPMPGHLAGDGPGGPGGPGGYDHDMHGGGDFEMHREMMWMHRHEMARHDMEGHGGRFGQPLDLEAADTDHDGKISWAEFQTAATARMKDHFDHLDANHDGFIEKDELPGHEEHHHHDGKDDKPASDTPPAAPPAK